jgi:hypothetical protein
MAASSMPSRFQKNRWTPLRETISKLNIGDVIDLEISLHSKARSIARNLSDAYQDRKWIAAKSGDRLTVSCVRNARPHALGETTPTAMNGETTSKEPSDPGRMEAIVGGLSARDRKRLAKKKAVSHILHLVRDWQTDGMPSSDNGIEPDADEVWVVVEWLQKRLRRHSANGQSEATPPEPQ